MLPQCLEAVRDAVDEIVVVDTGLHRPHRRDRRVFGATRAAPRVERATSPPRATSPSTRPRATGSCTSTPTRSSSPRTSRSSAPAPAASGARRSTSSRPTTPATSRTARPSRTTRCASSATVPSTASTAASTSRSPTACPAICPSASRSSASASSTSATSAPSATPRTSRGATSSCSSGRSPRASTRRSCVQPRLGVRRGRRAAARAGAVPQGLGSAARTTRTSAATGSSPRWRSPRQGPARLRPPRGGRCRVGDDGPRACFPGLTDVVLEQAHRRRGARRLDRAVELLEQLPGARRRARALLARPSAAAPSSRSARWPRCAARGATTPRPRRSCATCLGEHPRVPRRGRALRRRAPAPWASPAAEVVAAVHALRRRRPTPSMRFLLAVALYEARRGRRGRGRAARRRSPPARRRTPRAWRSPRRCSPRAGSPRPAQSAAEVPADAARRRRPPPAPPPSRACGRGRPGALDAASPTADAGTAGRAGAFAAWRGRGRRPARRRPPRPPLVATMLDALARLEAFDAFEAPRRRRRARSALPWRERRELLAGVYLRRGFLESAAEEWLAVVESRRARPRALLGLAEVAALRACTRTPS